MKNLGVCVIDCMDSWYDIWDEIDVVVVVFMGISLFWIVGWGIIVCCVLYMVVDEVCVFSEDNVVFRVFFWEVEIVLL